MKETTELLQSAFKTVNTIALIRADGKIDVNDVQHLIPLIFSWQAAIKDLKFASEAQAATPAQVDAAFATAAKELISVDSNFAAGFTNAAKGYYYTYWLAVRQGFEAGLAAA